MSGYESSAIELNFLILDYRKHITTQAQDRFQSKWCSLSLFNTCPSGLWIHVPDKTPNLAVTLTFSFFFYIENKCVNRRNLSPTMWTRLGLDSTCERSFSVSSRQWQLEVLSTDLNTELWNSNQCLYTAGRARKSVVGGNIWCRISASPPYF